MTFFDQHHAEPGWVGVYGLLGFIATTCFIVIAGVILDPTVFRVVKDGKWRGAREAGGRKQKKQLSETMFYVYPLTGAKASVGKFI